MKRSIRTILALVVVLAVLSVIGIRVRAVLYPPKHDPPRTVLAHTGDVSVTVQEVGTLAPVDKVDVRSKVAGRILTFPIEEGQSVHAGQLIATIDRTLLDPQIEQTDAQLSDAEAHLQQAISTYNLQVVQTRMAILQARANLESSKTNLAAVAAGARPQEVAEQQQAVERAKITLDDAERTLARKQALVAKGYVAQSEADTAQVAVDTAHSNLGTAQQSLALTLAGPRPQDIANAQAQVDVAQVQLETAQGNVLQNDVSKSNIDQARASVQEIASTLSQLEVDAHDTVILAPSSGTVLKKYKQVGEIVQSATTGFSDTESLLITLGNRLMVQVGINEVDISQVRQGAPVTVQVDAVPGATFSGFVSEIAPASTNAFSDTGAGSSQSSGISKFNVNITLQKADPRLRPGMSASVSILFSAHKHVVLLPLEAINFTGVRGGVSVLAPGGATGQRNIVVGLRDDRNAEILSGLKSGDQVVVAPPSGKRRTIDIFGG